MSFLLNLLTFLRRHRRVGCLLAAGLAVGAAGLPGGGAAPVAAGPGPALSQQLLARQALGHLLFFEPALSVNGKRSCASCHRPEKAFCDRRVLPRALRFADNLDRNAPTLLNAAGQATFFHDGRAGSMGDVVTAVLTSPREFGSNYAEATARLGSSPEYRRRFRQAFGSGAAGAIGPVTLAGALEAYVATLARQQAPYDLALRGGPALDTAARAGQALFAANGCGGCHAGPLFRDGQRHEIAPGTFVKTPTLRNVALTMPYGALGRYPALADVLDSDFHRRQLPQGQALPPAACRRLEAFVAALTDTVVGRSAVPRALPALPALPDRAVGGLY